MEGAFADLVQEPAKNNFRYICVGSLDDPEALPPKGEFFCKNRSEWMPEVPGELLRGLGEMRFGACSVTIQLRRG